MLSCYVLFNSVLSYGYSVLLSSVWLCYREISYPVLCHDSPVLCCVLNIQSLLLDGLSIVSCGIYSIAIMCYEYPYNIAVIWYEDPMPCCVTKTSAMLQYKYSVPKRAMNIQCYLVRYPTLWRRMYCHHYPVLLIASGALTSCIENPVLICVRHSQCYPALRWSCYY